MRRLSAALAIAVLAALLLPLCVSAETGYIPHEDPNAVIDELNQDAILLYYAQILMRIDQGDYTGAVEMLDKLKFAHIPEAQRQLLEKYSGLIGQLPDTVPACRNLLDAIMPLIAQYRLTEAQEKLDSTKLVIEQLSLTLADIEKDTENIGDAFGVFSSPSESLLNISFGALQNSIGLINEIEDKTSNLQTLINNKLAASTNRQKTTLTLEISPASAYVGDNITVSGSLSANTSRLAGKNISISLDGKIIATATTNSSGRYAASIQLPYKYASSMQARALYIPTGNDSSKYLPAVSPIQNISLKFYQSAIKINAPAEIYPGRSAVFNGTVSWEQPNGIAARKISIYLDGDLLGTVSAGTGTFEVKPTLNLNESPGKHTIRAEIAPDKRYAGASDEKTVAVSKAPIHIEVNAPSLFVLPGNISITGKITSDLPMKGGTAAIDFGGKSTTVAIQDNGEFSANLNLGLAQGFGGSQDLTVTVYPAEPWNAASTVKTGIFVLNAANLAGISLCLVAGATIGTVTYTRRRRRMPLSETTLHPIAPAAEKITEISTAAALQPGSGEPRERLLNAYVRAKDIVQKASAMKMEPQMTMREFSRAIDTKGIAAAADFARLTRMAEKALYSPYEFGETEAAAAEELLAAIMEAGKNAAA